MSGNDARKELIDGLNQDLAHEWAAVIAYTLRAQTLRGPRRPAYREFFEEEVSDELDHARMLARKIDALGGEPTPAPAPFEVGEDAREMFELSLAEERATVERYTRRIEQANEGGQRGLAIELEDLLADEVGHVEELEAILDGWD